eukprot:TRINITY_DN57392_c0_g1_i1.p1 TRINITY_DN57392_c0_g1~~TRINITY_DN57392_c0_g1_i1.p1  ORF type:complete len:151 (+),score=6.63 TRINITY_DN57392_c0_g1_i1:68-520(+)
MSLLLADECAAWKHTIKREDVTKEKLHKSQSTGALGDSRTRMSMTGSLIASQHRPYAPNGTADTVSVCSSTPSTLASAWGAPRKRRSSASQRSDSSEASHSVRSWSEVDSIASPTFHMMAEGPITPLLSVSKTFSPGGAPRRRAIPRRRS